MLSLNYRIALVRLFENVNKSTLNISLLIQKVLNISSICFTFLNNRHSKPPLYKMKIWYSLDHTNYQFRVSHSSFCGQCKAHQYSTYHFHSAQNESFTLTSGCSASWVIVQITSHLFTYGNNIACLKNDFNATIPHYVK